MASGNTNLIQDIRCAGINDRRSINQYAPLLGSTEHPAVANINAVKGEFVSALDTLEAEGIIKTPAAKPTNAKSVPTPHTVSLESLYNRPDPRTLLLKTSLLVSFEELSVPTQTE